MHVVPCNAMQGCIYLFIVMETSAWHWTDVSAWGEAKASGQHGQTSSALQHREESECKEARLFFQTAARIRDPWIVSWLLLAKSSCNWKSQQTNARGRGSSNRGCSTKGCRRRSSPSKAERSSLLTVCSPSSKRMSTLMGLMRLRLGVLPLALKPDELKDPSDIPKQLKRGNHAPLPRKVSTPSQSFPKARTSQSSLSPTKSNCQVPTRHGHSLFHTCVL